MIIIIIYYFFLEIKIAIPIILIIMHFAWVGRHDTVNHTIFRAEIFSWGYNTGNFNSKIKFNYMYHLLQFLASLLPLHHKSPYRHDSPSNKNPFRQSEPQRIHENTRGHRIKHAHFKN